MSENTWIFALANGLKAEFEDTRKGVLFGRPGYDTVLEVKKSIINEEIVLATMRDTSRDKTKEAKDKDSTAFLAKDHSNLNCHYCGTKGHIQPDCRKKKRDEQQGLASTNNKGKGKGKGSKGKGKLTHKGKQSKGKHYSNNNRHSNEGWNSSSSSDRSWNYSNDKAPWHTTNDKGQWASTNKGKDSKGKGNGRGRGWANGNFPSDYNGSYANIHQDSSRANETFDTSSQSQWTDSSSHNWVDSHDLGFVVLHNENDQQTDLVPSTNDFMISLNDRTS